jgi:hypothetical protein
LKQPFRSRRPRRRWLALAVLPLALALVTAPTTAADPADTGNVGVHTLIDTTEYPAVSCIYDVGYLLTKMKVRPPIIFAFDRTGGTDTETVGWRFRIQQTPNGFATYTPYYTSPKWKAVTTDRRAAPLVGHGYTFAPQVSGYRYRVLYDLYWYYPGATTLDGKAVHLNTYYKGVEPSGAHIWTETCISAD